MTEELKRSTFFAGFDANALGEIAAMASIVRTPAGQMIHDRDEPGRVVYFIRRGRVKQGFEVGPGKEVWFLTLGPGQAFGLPAVIPPRAYNTRAVACEDCEFLTIDGDRLLEYLENHPSLGMLFMERVAQLYQQRLNNCRLQVLHLMPTAESGPTLSR